MSSKQKRAATAALTLLANKHVEHRVHEYDHDAGTGSFGLEAAEKLGLPAERVFKTLVASNGDKLFVAVIPVDKQLDLKMLAAAAGVKHMVMANVEQAERSSGYVAGGISPIAQKRQLPTFVDESAQQFETIYVSGGKRGLDVELAPTDLVQLTDGAFSALTR